MENIPKNSEPSLKAPRHVALSATASSPGPPSGGPPSPPTGARELNLMFTFPSPQRGEGPGVTGRLGLSMNLTEL